MWLIAGGDSEIGSAAVRRMRAGGRNVRGTTRRSARVAAEAPLLDLSQSIEEWHPPAGTQAVCICAAISRLAGCAADPTGSAHINVTQTVALADRLIAAGIYVLYLSTNQVFDGTSAHVHPDAATRPISEYGRQKARTEAALRARMEEGVPVAVLRLAKVFSPETALLREWTNALSRGQPIRAFHDMTVAPAPIDVVVAAISALLDDRAAGFFQLTGPADATYLEVGRQVARTLGVDHRLVASVSVDSAALPLGAHPLYTTLDSSRLKERYGITVADARDVTAAMLVQMRPPSP